MRREGLSSSHSEKKEGYLEKDTVVFENGICLDVYRTGGIDSDLSLNGIVCLTQRYQGFELDGNLACPSLPGTMSSSRGIEVIP